MSRPEIWLVTPAIHRHGGTERCVAEEAERWARRFDLRIYSMEVGEDVDVSHAAVRRIPRPAGPQVTRFIWWLAANALMRAWDGRRSGWPDAVVSPGINAVDADVIGVHMVFAKYWERVGRGVWGDVMKPRMGLRAAHRILYTNFVRALEHHIYAGPALLWSISAEDQRELERRNGRPTGTVPNVPHGVDITTFTPSRRLAERSQARRTLGLDNERVVLLVGNDAWKKGADLAIRALAHLSEGTILAVAGGLDDAQVREVAERAGVADRICVWPHNADPFPYYAAADVLVAPSREDSFHLPAIEAMASGLPVVVSALAGVSELVEAGRHALVVRDPENVEKLASTIERALREEVGEELTASGRKLAERMTWDVNAERTADLIMREITTPRFLVLAPDAFGTGGIERTTRTLIRTLGDRFGPDRVGVLSVWGGRTDVPARILRRGRRSGGARPVPIPDKVAFAISSVRHARRWRRRLVVVACHPHLALVAVAAGRVAGVRVSVWCHGDEVWRPLRPSVRWALRRADLVFAPSRFTADQVVRWAGLDREVTVIPHGVPQELAPRKAAPMAGRVLTVARLEPHDRYKGVDTLIRAWPRVIADHPAAVLTVVGDGGDRDRLERLASHVGADGSVRFTGQISDHELQELYRTATLFALPTGATIGNRAGGEGFGLVFLEAAAAGLPVVAGRSGAVPEVVENGVTGLLVEPGDPNTVADAIGVLLKDEELRKRMARAARSRARTHFSYEEFGHRVESVLGGLAPVFVPEH